MSRRSPPPGSGADRLLARADRVLGGLEHQLTVVAGLLVFAMMWFVVAEVLSRRLLNAPIHGHLDLVELTMVVFAFLGIAHCQRGGGHVRMKLVVARLQGRSRWVMEAGSIVLALVVVGVLVKTTGDHFWRAWVVGDSTIDVQLPTWPSKLIPPAALATLWMRLLLQLWGYVRLVARPELTPLAVPVTPLVDEVGAGGGDRADEGEAGA